MPTPEHDWDQDLTEIITKGFGNAFARVENERKGEKRCGCGNCAKHAVQDINDWADFLSEDNAPHYRVADVNGKLRILSPNEWVEVDDEGNVYDSSGNLLGKVEA